jgi:hypothetical protein
LTRVVKQTIKIENPNSKPIAFKVKTTAPKLYCVRPNSDIIPPNETAEVQSKKKKKNRLLEKKDFTKRILLI